MSAVPESLFLLPGTPVDRSIAASRHDLGFARHVLAGLAARHKSIRIDELGDGVVFGSVEAGRLETLILRHCSRQIVAMAAPDASIVDAGDVGSPSTALLRAARDRNSSVAVGPCKRLLVLRPGRMNRACPVNGTRLLRRIGASCGADALLVAGVAMPSPRTAGAEESAHLGESVHRLIDRINEELGGDIEPGAFAYEVNADARRQCVEARMVSRTAHAVRVLGRTYRFSADEPIHLATWYPYSVARFESVVAGAGWQHCQLWSDGQARYAVHVLERSFRSDGLGS